MSGFLKVGFLVFLMGLLCGRLWAEGLYAPSILCAGGGGWMLAYLKEKYGR